MTGFSSMKTNKISISIYCIPYSLLHTHTYSLTHWKQDLLLIDQPYKVLEGQRIKGKVLLTRHKIWRRHLRVQLSYSLWNNEEKITEVIMI